MSSIEPETTNVSPPRFPKYLQIKRELLRRMEAGEFDREVPMPSEKMLAELSGVSIGTVRQALAEMAEEGLVRREQGRGTFVTLHSASKPGQRLSVLAFIAPQIREGVYPSFLHGFEEAATGLHHQVQVGNSQNDVGRQANIILGLIDQQVGGVAIVPVTLPATPSFQLRQLQKNGIPVVCAHRTVEGVLAPSVVFSGHEIGFKAADVLLNRGHRRIANVYAHRYSMVERREQGMRAAIAEHPEAHKVHLQSVSYDVIASSASSETRLKIGKALKELLAGPDRPTGIFCGSLSDAEQIYLHAIEAGLEIPRDISLVYFGSVWRPNALAERLSCIAVDERGMGACAAEILHEMQIGKRPIEDGEQIMFPTSLYEGESLGAAP